MEPKSLQISRFKIEYDPKWSRYQMWKSMWSHIKFKILFSKVDEPYNETLEEGDCAETKTRNKSI